MIVCDPLSHKLLSRMQPAALLLLHRRLRRWGVAVVAKWCWMLLAEVTLTRCKWVMSHEFCRVLDPTLLLLAASTSIWYTTFLYNTLLSTQIISLLICSLIIQLIFYHALVTLQGHTNMVHPCRPSGVVYSMLPVCVDAYEKALATQRQGVWRTFLRIWVRGDVSYVP